MAAFTTSLDSFIYVVIALQLLLAIGSVQDACVFLLVTALQVIHSLMTTLWIPSLAYRKTSKGSSGHHPLLTEAVIFWNNAASAAATSVSLLCLTLLTLAVDICLVLASVFILWLLTKFDDGTSNFALPSPGVPLAYFDTSPVSSPEPSCPSTPVSETPPNVMPHESDESSQSAVILFDGQSGASKEDPPCISDIVPVPTDEAETWFPDLQIPWIEHKIPFGGKPRVSGLDMQDLDLTHPLGSGAFSAVFKASTGTGKLYATKIILKEYIHPHPKVQFAVFKQEVLALAKVNGHPSFMNIYGAFESDEYFALLLKCYGNGTLEDLMRNQGGKLTYGRARWMAAELLEGLDFLHMHGVIYRDLKPSNILIDDAGHAIFTDFGLSFVFPATYGDESPGWRRARRRGGENFPPLFPTTDEERDQGKLINAHVISDVVGSRAYAAPEVLTGQPYSYGIDYFAMGILLYEMVTGELPYVEEREDFDGDDSDEEDSLTPMTLDLRLPLASGNERYRNLLNFLEEILIGSNGTPNSRLTVTEMKEHVYFADINWDQVLTRPMRVPS